MIHSPTCSRDVNVHGGRGILGIYGDRACAELYIVLLPTKKELLVQHLASVNIGDCLDYGPYVTENLG